jgi:hypothetical protein
MPLFIHHFPQTLTTLKLYHNEIGAQGAEHLANALQQNKVTLLTPLDFLCNCSFIIFHRHSQHWASHTIESVIKAQNILQMRCSKTRWHCSHYSTYYVTVHSSIFTDTHNTWPRRSPNRCSRRRTSCKCVAAKQGNIAHATQLPMPLFAHYLLQTLTTLKLYNNKIGDQGAEHLANALQQNKVTLLTLSHFLRNCSFMNFHRHSQHLTSEATESVLKAQNILQMRCSRTR